MRIRLISGATLLAILAAGGCAPCESYCQRACACEGEGAECVDACLTNLDLYDGRLRSDYCSDLIDEMDRDEVCLDEGDEP